MADDVILQWNEVALEANRVSHTNLQGENVGPPASARALAIVHLAMYDAFAGIWNLTHGPGDPKHLPPYLAGLPVPNAAASSDAAVAAAAHATLTALFPSQSARFNLKLASGDTSSLGRSFGQDVALAILADRQNDPATMDKPFNFSMPLPPGLHRPDPDEPSETLHAPDYGANARGFGITQRHTIAPPPYRNNAGTSYLPEYEAALREVRGKGIAPQLLATLRGVNGVQGRTMDESVAGVFWGYDGARELGTPPRLYNQIVRRVAVAKNNTTAHNARLFALVNVALADAGILAWAEKYRHNFWRPVIGVREHDESLGPEAPQAKQNLDNDGDPFWLPLGAPSTNSTLPPITAGQAGMPGTVSNPILLGANRTVANSTTMGKDTTPNFPAYPSGHATFGAAALHITRLFYGPQGIGAGGAEAGQAPEDQGPDTLFNGLDLISDEFNGINRDSRGTTRSRHRRSFEKGLWGMIVENARSRIFLGVHWSFDAFAVKQDQKEGSKDDGRERVPDLTENIGGVPLGLNIAEDIFQAAKQAGWRNTAAKP